MTEVPWRVLLKPVFLVPTKGKAKDTTPRDRDFKEEEDGLSTSGKTDETEEEDERVSLRDIAKVLKPQYNKEVKGKGYLKAHVKKVLRSLRMSLGNFSKSRGRGRRC